MSNGGPNFWSGDSPAGRVADIIIIGLQTTAWIWLAVLCFRDFSLSSLNPILLVTVVGIIGYSIGVTVDLVSAKFCKLVYGKSLEKELPEGVNTAKMNWQIMREHEYIHGYLAGLFSRLRIAKATLLNFPFFAAFGLLALCQQGFLQNCVEMLVLVFLSVLIWIGLRYFCIERDKHYHNSIIGLNSMLCQLKPSSPSPRGDNEEQSK